MNINAEVATLYPSRSNMKKIPNITNINVPHSICIRTNILTIYTINTHPQVVFTGRKSGQSFTSQERKGKYHTFLYL